MTEKDGEKESKRNTSGMAAVENLDQNKAELTFSQAGSGREVRKENKGNKESDMGFQGVDKVLFKLLGKDQTNWGDMEYICVFVSNAN